MFVSLEKENPLATQDLPTCRNVRMRNKTINTHLFETLELILYAKSPFGSVWRVYSLAESSGFQVLIRGEANSAAYASQKATKSASESRGGGWCSKSSGNELSGMESTGRLEVVGSEGATLVSEAHESKTCCWQSNLACAHCSLRWRPASRDSAIAWATWGKCWMPWISTALDDRAWTQAEWQGPLSVAAGTTSVGSASGGTCTSIRASGTVQAGLLSSLEDSSSSWMTVCLGAEEVELLEGKGVEGGWVSVTGALPSGVAVAESAPLAVVLCLISWNNALYSFP